VLTRNRLRRSLLYVPGDRENMLRRAPQRGADGLILNLEDAVGPANKELARAGVVAALRAGGFGATEVIVRINPLDSETGYRDLLAVVPARPDAILLPKTRTAEEVRFAAWTLARLEEVQDLPRAGICLMCMIESAAAVLAAQEIARADRRVSALVFGAADYAEDVGCVATSDRRAFLPVLTLVVLAARAAGIAAIDSPHMLPGDHEGLRQSAILARELGLDGKSAIHPDQVDLINKVFSPSSDEIRRAQATLAALGSSSDGRPLAGAALLQGELIEAPHLAWARRVLLTAEQLGLLLPSET